MTYLEHIFKENPALEEIRRFWYRFRKSPLSVISLMVVIALYLMALFAYQLAPYPEDETKIHADQLNKPPSLEHFFGTDNLGMDVFSRVLIGSRVSLFIGLAALVASAIIGISLGLMAGLSRGVLDWVIMRFIEVFLSIPPFVLALVLSVVLRPSLDSAIWAVAAGWWPTFARLVRTETLRIKGKEFVEAADIIGAGKLHIALKEILPNIIVPVIINFTLNIGYAISVLAMLGFLGLGARPPTPEWGTMSGASRHLLPNVWWPTLFPSLFIFISVAAFNFLGDGVQEAIIGIESE